MGKGGHVQYSSLDKGTSNEILLGNDGWLMIMLENVGYLVDERICLNRVGCHQQVILYSNIFDAGGRSLD